MSGLGSPIERSLKSGQTITTADQWWQQRRPGIVEDFEREIVGRVPKHVPAVTWSVVTQATDRVVGGLPVVARQLIGRVDNTACPEIKVEIQMAVVTPAGAKKPSPLLMMFGGGFGGSGFPRRAGDLPVDAHQLIALCAPRPTFISYGLPERGDAHWLDQQGSYMATVAAGPAFRLLGARDIGETNAYRVATMPPVNTSLLEGELAWRQHDGGHEDRSNMKDFIVWASRLLHHTPPAITATTTAIPATPPPSATQP